MFLILLAFAFFLYLVHQLWYKRLNYPPGPLPLPFIGNMHSLWNYERWEDKFLEWKDQYGKIYTFFMGNLPLILISDYQLAIDMFVKDGSTYENRYSGFEDFLRATRGGEYGIIDSSGNLWREQRKFTLRVLRDFGMGKGKMEKHILEEIQTIFQNVNKDIDAGIDFHDFHKHTDLTTGSVINSIVSGYRFSTDGKEDEFYKMKAIVDSMMKSLSDPLVNMAIDSPFLCSLPVIKPRYEKSIELFNQVFEFVDGIIDDHIKNTDYSSEIEPRDYIDAYLIEMHRSEERGENHYFSKLQLRSTMLDLWIAGQSTTSATITWTIAFLTVHQNVQAKLHEELDRVIGSDRLIKVEDKQSLPYCNAVIAESQRLTNLLSVNLFRTVARDVEVDGYHIKKGSIVVPMISVFMIDSENFDDPKKFNPSRFIDVNGQFKVADELVPFSIGKRQCLARMELFLIITNIFNQYKLTAADVAPELKREIAGVGTEIKPYKIRVNTECRKKNNDKINDLLHGNFNCNFIEYCL